MGGLKRLLLAGALAAASALGAAGQARADDDTGTPGVDEGQVPSVIEIQEEEVTTPTVDQTTATAHSISRATADRQKAEAASERAAKLEREGGWAWKTGAVQRAQREAVQYEQKADQELTRAGLTTSCSCTPMP
jgi:hypothetical protein